MIVFICYDVTDEYNATWEDRSVEIIQIGSVL